MNNTIYCLVDSHGTVHVKDGAGSYSSVAAESGLAANHCAEYRFDLARRQLIQDRETPASHSAALSYVSDRFGTPERLMTFAAEGHLPKQFLANLLSPEKRPAYDAACAAMEKRYTKACTDKGDPCLESGCALDGDVCLQPLLEAGIEYRKACAATWIETFTDPKNRVASWAH
jgi:hypothetical protein